MSESRHTFVVLAYGASPHLEACIQSIAAQTTQSRVCITTSSPNGHISELAEKYKIPVLVNTRGGSIGKDWNFGFAAATTPYVTLAHQDDLYLPEFVERCLEGFDRADGNRPLLAFTRSQILHGERLLTFPLKNIVRLILILPFHFKRAIASKFWKRFILRFSNSISCPGVMYAKYHLDGFSFDERCRYILDWKAWLEMSSREGAFVYIPAALHIHREHPESATGSTALEVLQQEELALLTEIWGSESVPRLLVKLLRHAKS